MSLDIHICGPGFGEMVLLCWNEGGTRRAGLIDFYAESENIDPLLNNWFSPEGVDHLAFVAVTHPHLDHLRNVHALLRKKRGKVERIWRWPGLDEDFLIPYFGKLAKAFPESVNHPKERSRCVKEFLVECRKQLFQEGTGKPILSPISQINRIYPLDQSNSDLTVTSFSPWEDCIFRFTEIVVAGVRAKGKVMDTHRECNLISTGFIVQYKGAQILLCGDVEKENWAEFLKHEPICPLRPCVVKVGHHGSCTGSIDEMWGVDGFVGKHRPIAVITPWNQRLPESAVINSILSSGSQLFVTGNQRPRTIDRLSRIHLRVSEKGAAEVVWMSPSVVEGRKLIHKG